MFSIFQSLQILLFITFFLDHLSYAEDKIQFIYTGFNEHNLNRSGIATVHQNGLLALTNNSYQMFGRAFYPFPFKFNNSSSEKSNSLSFSTYFVFSIVSDKSSEGGGHGFAFTISKSIEFIGAEATECLGLVNFSNNGDSSNHFFAVEFDTVLSNIFNDIDNNHVGIDINSLTSRLPISAAYFSNTEKVNKRLNLTSADRIQVWIDYDGIEKLLNVTLAPIRITKPEKPLISTTIDLSIVLSDSMYVGFSAATGSMMSYHYILGWSFNKSGPAQVLDASMLPRVPNPKRFNKQHDLRIMMALIATIIVLILIFGAVYIRRKKYEEVREDWEEEYGPRRFCYRDLYKATKGFKETELLGSGGFGEVYKGVLSASGTEIAVKKFSHESQQGIKQFIAEIASMGRLRHRNLVQLLGYCRRKGEMLLVYDYMPNGSLEKYLFQNNTPNLNWVQRYQILKGVASALLYLHEEWEQTVLHRDVKASNVMLDTEFKARLGDFGLAKFYDHGSIPQTTCVVGTIGYLAPEVSRAGRVTTSSDVFAFGILMLEVACGRKTLEPERKPEEVVLVDWVFECWRKGIILETSDRNLNGKYMMDEMELVLLLGLHCAHSTPALRPTMKQVVQYLERKVVMPDIPVDYARMGLLMANHKSNETILSSSLSNYCSSLSTTSILSYGR